MWGYDEKPHDLGHLIEKRQKIKTKYGIAIILLLLAILAVVVVFVAFLTMQYAEIMGTSIAMQEHISPQPQPPPAPPPQPTPSPTPNPPQNLLHMETSFNIFLNFEDTEPIAVLPAQTVELIDTRNDWLLISTDSNLYWVNPHFSPPTYELDEFLAELNRNHSITVYVHPEPEENGFLGYNEYGEPIAPPPPEPIAETQIIVNNFSAYFINLETGFTYSYNADQIYFSASVPKAMLGLWIYKMAEEGLVDLESTTTYTAEDFWPGSGTIQFDHSVGTELTQNELLRLLLSVSDNIATLMLIREHGLEGYTEFIRSIGGNADFVGERVMNSNLTASEAAFFARQIHAYIQADNQHGLELKEHLLNNVAPLITADYPIASKSGWTRNVWHDLAIVYAPSPYILILLSNRDGLITRDHTDFLTLSTMFQDFNNRFFVP